MIAVMLTILAMALPATDSVLADPSLRFALIIAAMALLIILLLRALHPEAEVHYVEAVVDRAPAAEDVLPERDWLSLYIELRAAARRRLEVRHRLSREELETALASAEAECLVEDHRLIELLTCDLKRRYLHPGAELEATFVDLLQRVEAMQ